MKNHPRPPITAGILAGGRGSRLGGVDKGLVDLDGRPLIAHVIERLVPQTRSLILSANRHLARYRGFGHRVFRDDWPGFQGPLAGIGTLLKHCPDDWLLICPCDTPRPPHDFAARLWAGRSNHSDIVVAHDGRRRQHAHALIATALLDDLVGFLADGGHGLGRWYQRLAVAEVDFSDCASGFENINTRRDLTAMRRRTL